MGFVGRKVPVSKDNAGKHNNPLVDDVNRSLREDLANFQEPEEDARSASDMYPDEELIERESQEVPTLPEAKDDNPSLAGSVKSWFDIQTTIHTYLQKSFVRDWKVTASVNGFRLALWQVAYKDAEYERQLWAMYDDYYQSLTFLSAKTNNTRLYLKRYPELVQLREAWEELLHKQKRVLSRFSVAPDEVTAFNAEEHQAAQERDRRRREMEENQRLVVTRKTLGKTLAWVNSIERKEIITRGAKVLSLDSAQRTWALKLREISELESAETRDVDYIISLMIQLDKLIQNAPLKAFRVAEVEREFYTFTELQDELATYQRSVVPKSEYAQMLIMVEDKVPKLWAAGDWPQLEKTLDEITEFVKKYEMLVRSELVIQNKRNSYLGEERGKTSLLTPKYSGGGTIRQFMPFVRTLVGAIDARDTYMAGHSDLVARYSVLIAKKLGWAEENLNELEIAALLHDVGKVNIPEAILTKTERLTSQEWETIRLHPYYGAKIVKPIEALAPVIPWIYHHQERWDGRGYPDRIAGKNIPLAARIISTAEAFTAMIAGNFHRPSMTPMQAAKTVLSEKGTAFDPEIAEALVEVIDEAEEPNGGPGVSNSLGILPLKE